MEAKNRLRNSAALSECRYYYRSAMVGACWKTARDQSDKTSFGKKFVEE